MVMADGSKNAKDSTRLRLRSGGSACSTHPRHPVSLFAQELEQAFPAMQMQRTHRDEGAPAAQRTEQAKRELGVALIDHDAGERGEVLAHVGKRSPIAALICTRRARSPASRASIATACSDR